MELLMTGLIMEELTAETEQAARELILTGFLDYFSMIDDTLNPDVYNLLEYYSHRDHLLLVGRIDSEVVCTGGLVKETDDSARIVRMSVSKKYRNLGIASIFLKALEKEARSRNYRNILIETTADWESPIHLYKKFNYKVVKIENGQIHFIKYL
jgi:ribosomal protein S18 acetylase RimI-like enzyme